MTVIPGAPNFEKIADLLKAEFRKLEVELRGAAAASIAGGMIAATGRTHTVEEAVKLWHRVHYAIDSRYQQGTLNREIAEREHPLDKPHE